MKKDKTSPFNASSGRSADGEKRESPYEINYQPDGEAYDPAKDPRNYVTPDLAIVPREPDRNATRIRELERGLGITPGKAPVQTPKLWN